MKENSFIIIEKYLRKKYEFLDKVNIHSDMLVEYDLGFSGDDAVDFITDFSNEFKIDISKFDFGYHFGPDGVDFIGISIPINWFLNLFRKEKVLLLREDFKPLSIGDLEEALNTKVLK
jgi:hypothetical protein